MSQKALLIMAKEPQAGRTKTRLCPPLHPEQAADLYACFLQDITQRVGRLREIDPFFAIGPDGNPDYFNELAPQFQTIVQVGANLGDRLDHVLSACLQNGYQQVAAINSDGPTLPIAFLEAAFDALDQPEVDMVLGPCDDGGYYLIGWKRPHPAVVREVQMSTPRVLADTLAIAEREKLHVHLLPTWFDVDDVNDLQRLWASLAAQPEAAPATFAKLEQLIPALSFSPPA